MAQLTKYEISQLKSLMTDERWSLVVQLLAKKIFNLNAEPITGTNEFETLRALHCRDGAVKGLTDFFDELDRGAFND